MAKATRTEAREVTENHTAVSLDYLKPGDRVVEAGVFQIQVERTETTPGKVVLELTLDEANFLADIMGNISGSMASRRRHQAAISEALRAAGLRRTYKDFNDLHGVIGVSET